MTDGEMGIETSEPYFPQGPRVCLPYNCAWAEVFPPACWLIYGRRWWLASRTECDAKMDAKDSHSPWLRLWKSVQSIRKKHVYSYVLFLIDGCGQPDQAREQSPNGQRFQMQATRALRWHDFIGLLGSRKTSISEQPFLKLAFQQTILVTSSAYGRSWAWSIAELSTWQGPKGRCFHLMHSSYTWVCSHICTIDCQSDSEILRYTEICAVQGGLSWVRDVFWRLLQETQSRQSCSVMTSLTCLSVPFQFLPQRSCNTVHPCCSTISGWVSEELVGFHQFHHLHLIRIESC